MLVLYMYWSSYFFIQLSFVQTKFIIITNIHLVASRRYIEICKVEKFAPKAEKKCLQAQELVRDVDENFKNQDILPDITNSILP